ncbi:MAG: M20/M25/M40 family metallo-hydrolase [Candidatus Cloacimonetes bacterium]|nr:M20/M25/M40 family metallo-hydrolase [Candidatus Cloacimonadota bacterium]
MERIELLKKLVLTAGISGYETQVANIMKSELTGIDNCSKDNLGSIAFELEGEKKKPRVLVVGHMDEIGFIVQDILPSGLIKIQPIGGWNPNTLMSSPMAIINSKNERIHAVIAAIPVHYLKGSDSKAIEVSDLFLDAGACSDNELKEMFGINIGDPIVPVCSYNYNEKTRIMTAKAFDDRVGIAVAIETAKHFQKNPHPNTLICAGSVQEEVGTRGAQTLARLTKPDLAIIIEGAPADDFPGKSGNSQTIMGKGAHVRVYDPTIIVKKELKDFVFDIANKYSIPIQPAVRTGGGTDARVIHLSDIGIPSIVFGVPVRYAHSHNGMMSMDDFDSLLSLTLRVIENLTPNIAKKINS